MEDNYSEAMKEIDRIFPQITKSPEVKLEISIRTKIRVKCFECGTELKVIGHSQEEKDLMVYVDLDNHMCSGIKTIRTSEL